MTGVQTCALPISAAAVLSALGIELLQKGVAIETALLLLTVIGLLCGLFQIVLGVIGLGRLIKYMPYPVVSGYLSGVGLYIIASQVPKLLAVPKEIHFWESLASPALWQWQAIVVGVATIVVMVGAPKFTKAVPAAILGLLGGVLTYFALALLDRSLFTVSGNPFIIGPLGGSGDGFLEALQQRWQAIGGMTKDDLMLVLVPALTLTVLLSIDTLKTCVVLDALTRSRHDSNQELIGQAQNAPAVEVQFEIDISGQRFVYTRPVQYKFTDPVKGEIYRPVEILPPVVIGIDHPVVMFPDNAMREITVRLTSVSRNSRPGVLEVTGPSGWSVTPSRVPFEFSKPGQVLSFPVRVTPSSESVTGDLKFSATTGEWVCNTSVEEITYDHIPVQTLQPPAVVRLVRSPVAIVEIGRAHV